MDAPILRNLGPSDLAEAADTNFATHAAWLARRLRGMTVVDRPDLLLVDSGLPCDTYNVICRARLESHDAHERARSAVAHFRQAQRPFSWWVGPADRPTDLGAILLAAGLSRAETELAMSASLSELPRVQGPPPLRVARVASEPELRAFAAISAANWQPPDPQVLRFYDLASSALLAGDCPQWLYLGFLGDTPVATAELTVAGGVVGLYGISTLAAHRGLGFGTALTLRPLLDAGSEAMRRPCCRPRRPASASTSDWASERSGRSRNTSPQPLRAWRSARLSTWRPPAAARRRASSPAGPARRAP